ncbi:hypothetical protein DPMN_087931 [Dreissena polymorpha]|uniref:Uncharacterized protein n=1 Tax=Dreissena polymorpha TaxID=45954 RepID=A0A9D4KTW9_DREPO|nr:hypothetical protein DPMN_087931 [Dreissena polymorpha]
MLWKQLGDLDIADDLAFLSHAQKQMKTDQDRCGHLKCISLFINRWTSNVFYSNEFNGTHITAQYGALEDREKLNIGSILDKNAGTEADFRTRISNTRGDWSELVGGLCSDGERLY